MTTYTHAHTLSIARSLSLMLFFSCAHGSMADLLPTCLLACFAHGIYRL